MARQRRAVDCSSAHYLVLTIRNKRMQPVESDIADADILRDAVKKYAVIDGDKCGQNVE